MQSIQQLLTLTGAAGNIEAVLSTPENQKNIFAIVCHPHPLFAGTMNNKVVTTLVKTFNALGITTLRFNFRGVGKSAGVYAEGKGETADVIELLKWVQKNYPNYKPWLAGFSFGGFVATQTATQWPVDLLLTVAPAVDRFKLSHLEKITCPWIIVQGEQDEVVAPQIVFNWAAQLPQHPLLIRMPGASHFFHGQLISLQTELEKALISYIPRT